MAEDLNTRIADRLVELAYALDDARLPLPTRIAYVKRELALAAQELLNAAGVPACAEPLPQRYTAGDIMQVISEYGVARYSEGVSDAMSRQQMAVESHSAAKDRFNDLRLMLDTYGVAVTDHQTFSRQTPTGPKDE